MLAMPARVVTASGAGDCLVAGCCWGLLKGHDTVTALAHGMVSLAALSCCRTSSIIAYAQPILAASILMLPGWLHSVASGLV